MPIRVGPKGERGGPKPFSTEWILAPPEEAAPRHAPELPGWIPSERKALALFIIVLTIIISIGGSSGGTSQEPDENENRPVVQTPIRVTATTGPAGVQPVGAGDTEPQPPPRSTTAPTQGP